MAQAARIRIRGAVRHNLQGVDLDLPRHGLTVLVGPSGSGKSTLALDTIHAAARSRLAQALGGVSVQADSADDLELSVVGDLPLTLAVSDRHPPGRDQRVIDVLGITPQLVACGRFGGAQHCPDCGRRLPLASADEIVETLVTELRDRRLVLLAPLARARSGDIAALIDEVARQGFTRLRLDGRLVRIDALGTVDARRPHDLDVVIDRLRVRPDRVERIEEAVGVALSAGRGRLLALCGDRELALGERPWCPDHPQRSLKPMRGPWLAGGRAASCPRCRGQGEVDGRTCPACGGGGLRPEFLHWRLQGTGLPWPAVFDLPLAELGSALRPALGAAEPVSLLTDLEAAGELCARMGIATLTLGRRLGQLSSTERRRLALASAILLARRIPGSLLIADEPLAGLDEDGARQVGAVLSEEDVDVLAVTHRRCLVDRADHCVAFGPGAGRRGGRVVWQGPGAALPRTLLPPPPADSPPGERDVGGASWVLVEPGRGPRARLLRGGLNALTAPPGGGKSRYLQTILLPALRAAVAGGVRAAEPPPGQPPGHGGPPGPPTVSGAEDLAQVLSFDRSPLGRSARSCVATVLGVWTPLRSLLASTRTARIQGFDAARFRFDQPGGRCEACQGSGLRPGTAGMACPVCGGHRFQRDTLRVRLKGRTVAELLDSDIATARELFAAHRKLGPALQAAELVGLGYLPLGQPSATLSGGEAQRLRLARELARAGRVGGERRLDDRVVVLDAPTVGLHPDDIRGVVELLRRLADRGATIVAATTSPWLVAAADHVMSLSRPPPRRR